ncbi:hypothetical protein [Nocardia sp. NPDC059691]|uniref:hypothetical protein n=1 Tax=Nocardia sp. NPDC059691 TaxID=3346908 RepID=UPI0036823BA1
MSDDELTRQLRRCLNDETLPLCVRVAGSLIRLYALPVSRMIELTVDQIRREGTATYLVINRCPVIVPPRLAVLVDRMIAQGSPSTSFRWPAHQRAAAYLFPGRMPDRPRSATAVRQMLAAHDLPVRRARNAAMIDAVSRMHPVIVADLFGISIGSAQQWAAFAHSSWADYLAAALSADGQPDQHGGGDPDR